MLNNEMKGGLYCITTMQYNGVVKPIIMDSWLVQIQGRKIDNLEIEFYDT